MECWFIDKRRTVRSLSEIAVGSVECCITASFHECRYKRAQLYIMSLFFFADSVRLCWCMKHMLGNWWRAKESVFPWYQFTLSWIRHELHDKNVSAYFSRLFMYLVFWCHSVTSVVCTGQVNADKCTEGICMIFHSKYNKTIEPETGNTS